MKVLIDSFKKNGNLHHAYAVVGTRKSIFDELLGFLEHDVKVKIAGNPDFWKGEFDSFGVDESRDIFAMQSNRAFGEGNKKVFVIMTNSITREAQNALLKVFEEPTPDTHFFLIMPSVEVLLPTLRSRLQIIAPLGHRVSKLGEAKEFLSSSIPRRLILVKKLAEEIADEEKTKSDAIVFLNALEESLRASIGNRIFKKEEVKAFEELLKFRDYLNDRAPSVKMVLEHLALVLPHERVIKSESEISQNLRFGNLPT